MKHKILFFSLWMNLFIGSQIYAQPTLKLADVALMHEMRESPSPYNKQVVEDRAVSFQWILPSEINLPDDPLDGMESKLAHIDRRNLRYKIRYSQDSTLKKGVISAVTKWPLYNPEKDLEAGKWYWQYGYVQASGDVQWSDVLQFTVKYNPGKFLPPSLKTILNGLPATHPRVWAVKGELETFRMRARSMPESTWYLERAERILKTVMLSVDDIDTSKIGTLDNEVKRKALLTRESRRIVDAEESNIEVLIRSYLLTGDSRYSTEAMKRITKMVDWKHNPNIIGDFNASTMLSLASMAYDSFYNILSVAEKRMLLDEIRHYGNDFYYNYNNHLENHIADNHVWQVTLRILTMAAFSVYGELPEAETWVDYCYNVWLARFPGLNKDGGWHNGDSYFQVNIRTLIEVPYFFSRLTGFDYFKDPWYEGSAMYTIYQQPPFSRASGNGSSHRNVKTPSGVRVGYADALARLTGNTYAADYVRRILAEQPNVLRRTFMAKPGDLSWFRMQCDKPLPSGKGLIDLPLTYIFPQTGIATFMSDWKETRHSAMLSFRSSPYGSTSHALANQNAFNVYYGGEPLFYSSGHHISFTDAHSVYCHRATRAHNSILVNGMGQRIGVEGYGWIPRHYTGDRVSYLVGDASNAYGEVISRLWQERGIQSGLEFSPQNGWDKNHLKTFRRHIVSLGGAGLIFIYDELEADTAVTWSYLLHTEKAPMKVTQERNRTSVSAVNNKGISTAYIFTPDMLSVNQTDSFFYPAVNWLRADAKGNFPPYENHWHFMATTSDQKVYRFATFISTHGKEEPEVVPQRLADGSFRFGSWTIHINLSVEGKPFFSVKDENGDVSVVYDDSTLVKEGDKESKLVDTLPELEI